MYQQELTDHPTYTIPTNFTTYQELLKKLKKNEEKSFYVLSHIAWLENSQKKEQGEVKDADFHGGHDSQTESRNIILFGPPGTGKTYNTVNRALELFKVEQGDTETRKSFVDTFRAFFITDIEKDKDNPDKRIVFTTFHQSYGYEDFVEGIKVEGTDKGLTYPVKSGVFKALCDKAQNDKDKRPYVIIIDEINRGNISKIFGELITLIETDKREGEDEAITVMLPYSKTQFSVPNNVYIIGTMNTADASIAKLDIALRRRFDFEEIQPNPKLLTDNKQDTGNKIIVEGVNLCEMLTAINQRIELLYDRDHTIGHSFFMSLTNDSLLEDLKNVFLKNVIPLLQEYFFEDWQRIHWVLDCLKDQNNPKRHFVKKKYDDELIKKLMGDEWNKDNQNNYVDTVWELNKEAFNNVNSYLRIYMPLGKSADLIETNND